MRYSRALRVSEEIRKVVGEMLIFDIKDPRLSMMTSVTRVETTNDYKYSTIYVSVMDTNENKEKTMVALKKASGFIRREIGRKIKLRNTPELKFILDESIEYSSIMDKKIKEVIKKDEEISNTSDEEI